MANKNTLEIIIKANATQAVQALNKLQSTVAKPFTGLQKQVGSLGTAFTSVTGISLGAAGAFAALGMAASKATDFIKQSVTETVAYAQSVRELSYVLGTSAEETSRIIQVADDYLISTEKLTTALRFAVKNGFEPSIDSLAQLADEFNAISDPNERAARMVQIFGRNWSALVPLLKAGGSAIRENAAAINDALIITEASQDAIFEYQQSLDNLDDTVQALKVSIGMAMVPALNDALGVINKLTPALNLLDDVAGQNVITAYALAAAYMVVSKQDFSLEGFAKAAKDLNAGFEAAQKGAAWKPYDEIKRGVQGTTVALEDGEGAVKDYAKAITKLGLSTAQENDLIAQFAASLGGVDISALTAANDMDLLDAAVAANAITLQEYTAIALQVAQGTGELDDTTRAYLETQLAAASGQKGVTNALEGTANAATQVRDQLVTVIGLAGQLRGAGPREVRNIVIDQLMELLKNVDPSKADAAAKMIEDIGLAFGVFNKNDLAQAEAIPEFVKMLFSGVTTGLIPDDVGDVLLQEFLDQIRDLESKGIPLDLSKLFQPYFSASDMARGGAGSMGGTANPLLEQLLPTDSDIQAVTDEYAKVPQEIQKAIVEPMTALNLGETLALPVDQVAAAVGTLGENAGAAQSNIGNMANVTGTFAKNAGTLNEILLILPARIENLGKKAVGAYQPMRDLATSIGDAAKSAQGAATFVSALALAIAALKDKTVTITANVVVNDPLGLLGGGGPGGGGDSVVPSGYQRGQKRASGGLAERMKRYLVGERGPELFIPSSTGTIVPTDVTQAAIIAAATMDAFGGNRGQTPSERAKNRRKTSQPRQQTGSEPAPIIVSGAVPQPTAGYQFLGENLNAYFDLFQPPFTTATSSVPEPVRPERVGRDASSGGGTSRFPGRGSSEPTTAGQQRRQQQALQKALEQTYQPLGSNLFQAASQGSGVLSTEQAAVATADTETERIGKTVTYNNYFPVQKLEDELDARDLARKVAAELARMPSR